MHDEFKSLCVDGFFPHVCRCHEDAAVIMWFGKTTDELVERWCVTHSGDSSFVCGVAERVHVNLLLCAS